VRAGERGGPGGVGVVEGEVVCVLELDPRRGAPAFGVPRPDRARRLAGGDARVAQRDAYRVLRIRRGRDRVLLEGRWGRAVHLGLELDLYRPRGLVAQRDLRAVPAARRETQLRMDRAHDDVCGLRGAEDGELLDLQGVRAVPPGHE